jgi:hypothetical protein
MAAAVSVNAALGVPATLPLLLARCTETAEVDSCHSWYLRLLAGAVRRSGPHVLAHLPRLGDAIACVPHHPPLRPALSRHRPPGGPGLFACTRVLHPALTYTIP